MHKIGIIGIGQMGEAILKGIATCKKFNKEDIFIFDIDKEKLKNAQKRYKVSSAQNISEIVEKANLIIIAVKPKDVEKVLEEIKVNYNKNVLVSVAAGISTEFIESKFKFKVPVIRVMPNILCMIKEGISSICAGKYAQEKDVLDIVEVFSSIGETIIIDEKNIDAITALSGSGPAYISLIIEALSDAGVKVGLNRSLSLSLAVQTTLGTAKLIKEEKIHPTILKEMVTSPGGTTAAGLLELENGKTKAVIIKAVESAYKRAKEISSSNTTPVILKGSKR